MSMDIKSLSQSVASEIGRMLRQEYRFEDGAWWLYSLGERQDALTGDEVQWHVARNHAPFCEGGVEAGDPRWWVDPS
jgi:hypothetical protein